MSIALQRNNSGGGHRIEGPGFVHCEMAYVSLAYESPDLSAFDRSSPEEEDPNCSLSSSSTSSIGRNSDARTGGGTGGDEEEECQLVQEHGKEFYYSSQMEWLLAIVEWRLMLPKALASTSCASLMDSARYTVTLDEFKLFHGIDRELYVILIRDLLRNPLECLYIMGLWLWLERAGFYHFISKILPLPPFLINELADEAVACIKCINMHFPFSSESTEIPLTHCLVKKDISLMFFQEKQGNAFQEVETLVRSVCIPSLSDIMENGHYGSFLKNSVRSQMAAPSHAASTSSANPMQEPLTVDDLLMQSFPSLGFVGDSSPSGGKARAIEASRNERTMFVTFSKGYPVTENEVRLFFSKLFGNCIESFHMQEVRADEQSLYAKIVFLRESFIRSILNGVSKAKFTINGKHVWMRKYVPKTNRPLPCGCPSIGACSCCFF